MRPTINDVAAAAGVSIKTVSRVLNNEAHVRKETQRKVREAVEALDFRPNAAARVLAGGRSWQIALLYDNPSPYYVYHIQSGARDRSRELGFRLLFQECDVHSATFLDEVKALVDETHVGGLILTPPVTDQPELLVLLKRRSVPFVRIAPGNNLGICPYVHMDDVAASMDMTRYLARLGHRRIGFIAGHPDHCASRHRLKGFRKGLAGEGIAEEPMLVRKGQFSYESGRDAALDLFQLEAPPTAIFASNDDMAAGALAAAHEQGIAVPGELSIAGFDDTDLARALWPPLTTIHQPTRELAYAAADLLLSKPKRSPVRALPYRLVERGSTASPRRDPLWPVHPPASMPAKRPC